MTSVPGASAVRIPWATGQTPRRFLRAALPAISLALVILGIAWLNQRAISYFGLNLMLNLGIPVALATIAQMFVITVNDLDLSIGTFVSFVGCVAATWLRDAPLLGVAVLLAGVGVYALIGAVIYLRNVPSIVVTLGMLFVWQGLAILLLPKPGGKPPDWLHGLMNFRTPYVPFPIIAGIVIAVLVHIGLMRTSYGAILRGSGGNPNAIARAGWSLLKTKIIMYALAGIFGVLSGLALIGLTTSADANIGKGYTLAFDRRRHPRRRGIRWRTCLADRGGNRRVDSHSCGLAYSTSCGSHPIGRSARRERSSLSFSPRAH